MQSCQQTALLSFNRKGWTIWFVPLLIYSRSIQLNRVTVQVSIKCRQDTHTHTAMAVQASILRCDLISYWVLKCLFVCEQTKRHPVMSHHFFLACLAAATENKRDCSHKHVQINMNPKKQNNTFVQVEQMINLEKIKTNCVSICSNISVQTCQDTTGLLIMLMSLLPSRENSWHWGVFVKRLNSCLELQSSWFPEDEPYCLQLSLIFTSLPKSSKF